MIGHGPGTTAPTARMAGRALATRVLVPTAALWVAVVGAGFLVVDVLALDERAINAAFEDARTPALNDVSAVVSRLGDTEVLIATCLLVAAFIWWQSRQWWFAMVPVLALGLQALVFITSSIVVGRSRPEVEPLSHAPPTSSFPSGHTGATAAAYLAFALCATRIRHTGLRITIQVLCVVMPIAMAVSRIYRGMHHPTDVIMGLIVGATCALIAWNWLPTRDAAERVIEATAADDSARASARMPSERDGTTTG
ncbi:phosphatase PAP2 family protein [Demequina muriae]|uniref:Phosphatase PAP2 family protein n=1 Tax=Demequina muriae TaxID=3051664 RepID=A0ABT8GF60_9MICO|nr:phosphatase PAP2 family protein [Demequina sp. EGI L300058]MDN4480072.1 phosphatase PAP2 family protein [Demequina sp. EGI L300058]